METGGFDASMEPYWIWGVFWSLPDLSFHEVLGGYLELYLFWRSRFRDKRLWHFSVFRIAQIQMLLLFFRCCLSILGYNTEVHVHQETSVPHETTEIHETAPMFHAPKTTVKTVETLRAEMVHRWASPVKFWVKVMNRQDKCSFMSGH